ncbi:MAG: transporter substrate-binding domain-containing protein [Rhodocyclales bacterium]|nr:transporter substrate-binding domain-containing protein [Rhodocyclales bacterium]
MKRSSFHFPPWLRLAAGPVLLALAWSVQAADPACRIVIGSCQSAPLSTPEGTGILDQVAIEAFRRIGYKACIESQPCERSLRNADAGATDGDLLRVAAAVLPKAPNLLAVPEVIYVLPSSAFTARPDLQVRGFDDLLPLRVGVVLGWKRLEEQVRATEVLRVRGPEELFALLVDDKADIVIYERSAGLHLLKELNRNDIRVIDPPLVVVPTHMVLNRKHQALLGPLAAALRAMKADGSYAAGFRDAGVALPEAK